MQKQNQKSQHHQEECNRIQKGKPDPFSKDKIFKKDLPWDDPDVDISRQGFSGSYCNFDQGGIEKQNHDEWKDLSIMNEKKYHQRKRTYLRKNHIKVLEL